MKRRTIITKNIFLCIIICGLFSSYSVVYGGPRNKSAANSYQTLGLTMNGGHLYSNWEINKVKSYVMLETAFPMVVFDSTFVMNNIKSLKFNLKEAPVNAQIAFWGYDKRYKVSYTLEETVSINGIDLQINALVVNLAKIDKKPRDVIFPINFFNRAIEINIKKRYMKIYDTLAVDHYGKSVHNMVLDTTRYKRQYMINSEIRCCNTRDTIGIAGNFLLDLGCANAFVFDKNNPNAELFMKRIVKVQSGSLGTVSAGGLTNVSVVAPDYLLFDKFQLKNIYVCGMSLFKPTQQEDMFTGIIGNRFFERFIIIFDFANNKFYLNDN